MGKKNSLLDLSPKELLQFCTEQDMINQVERIANQIQMKKREEYIKQHPYTPWRNEKNGKWYVYLPDEQKGRVQIKRKTKQQLLDAIADYWERREFNPTIGELFHEWLDKKMSREEIERSTADRYTRDFNKFFDPIRKKDVKGLSEYDLEEFIRDTIHTYDLTAKSYSNIRTLLYGIFRMAKKKGLIAYSITSVVKDFGLSKKIFSKPVCDKAKMVLNDDELAELRAYFSRQEADIVDLGLYLDSVSGLRIGELSALKMRDIDFIHGTIHVCRTEIRYSENGTSGKRVYEVRDFPKTEAGIREVIIPENSRWVLHKIRKMNPFGEYFFEQNGERVRTYVFRNRLKYACNKNGIPPKPPHALRRTYATILIDNGVEQSLILAQMGHTEIETTLEHYYKDRATSEQKRTIIDQVNGL